jgi:hypothetical protein
MGSGSLLISKVMASSNKYDRQVWPLDACASAKLEPVDFRQSNIADQAIERLQNTTR